jgi:cytochrome c-type biogenesis protein CcmH
MTSSLRDASVALRRALAGRWILLAALLLLIITPSAAAIAQTRDVVPGEKSLIGRLVAPCCWNQTLDIHDSQLAKDLRTEIHDRLARGERAAAVEDSLVARYGERIRGTPPGDRLGTVALLVWLLAALAAGGLLLLVRRWAASSSPPRAAAAPVAPSAPAMPDPWEERLNAELKEMEE